MAEVPQGSALGPLVWNIMYDGIFKPKVGFADDVTNTVQARSLEEVQLNAYEAIRTIKKWLESVKLNLVDQKN